METVFMISMLFITIMILILFIKSFLPPKTDENTMIPLSMEQKRSDMELVYSAINDAINKSLYYYVSKDITFSSSSKVKTCIRGHYRDLISCLIRPDVTFEDDGKVEIFLNYFINRVYMIYVSETSMYVKNLLYKYYSGFSPETYFTKTKKDVPISLYFVSEYVRNNLLYRFNENEIIQAELYNQMQYNNEDVDKMTDKLHDYDMSCVYKLSLNIYNLNGTHENTKTIKREVKSNELSSKNNEQSK